MLKWYQKEGKYKDVVISSRVRIARNTAKYPFSIKITDKQAKKLVDEVESNIKIKQYKEKFNYIRPTQNEKVMNQAFVESYIASPLLVGKEQETLIILSEDESISVMVNEEDHFRIQALVSGMNIDKAYKLASSIDDLFYDQFDYAYSEKYGYLTSCPTNLGTGLRASYMLHLPALENANKIQNYVELLVNYGMTIRGIHGEGTKSQGSLYQISNQKTLGQSEAEIMGSLNSVVMQIIRQERKRRDYSMNNQYNYMEDQIYRSYGVLKYARQISVNDAMTLLSQVRLGIICEILHLENEVNIYEIMKNIQPGNLQINSNVILSSLEKDTRRAEYIRTVLPNIV